MTVKTTRHLQLDTPLEQYIAWGFVWDERKARRFAQNTIEAISDYHFAINRRKKSSSVLEEVVSITFEAGKLESLVFPLSGGLDSRSILAGFLANYDRTRVSCYTFGEDDSTDVIVAKSLCRKLGIDWHRVDPVEDFSYDLTSLTQRVQRVQRVHRDTGTYALVESVASSWLIDQVSVDRAAVVLTGWPGRPVGTKLTRNIPKMDRNAQLAHFFENAVKGYAPHRPYIANGEIKNASDFLRSVRKQLSPQAAITDYEIIAFVFQSHLRVQGGVNSTFTHGYSPFIHLNRLAHWFGRPVEDRVNRRGFRAALATSYPHIFADLQGKRPQGQLGPSLSHLLRKQAGTIHRSMPPSLRKKADAIRQFMSPAGAPLADRSYLIAVLAEAEQSLRKRGLPELEPLLAAGEEARALGGNRIIRYAW